MGSISEYIHKISSLEVYPRIFYFQNRYADLLGKFKKVTGKYPSLFGNKSHDILDSPFDNGVELRVVGESDISPMRFIPVESRLYKVAVPRRSGITEPVNVDHIVPVDPVQCYTSPGPSETRALNEAVDTRVSSITVTICHVTVQRLDAQGLEKVTQLLRQVSNKSSGKGQNFFLLCRTYQYFTKPEEETFKCQIEHEIRTLLPLHIVIGTGDVSIKEEISIFLETECVKRFISLENSLEEYTKGQRKPCLVKSVLDKDTVARQIKRCLLNVHKVMADEKVETDTEEKLAKVVKCIAVNEMSEKYNLKVWVCNGIVDANGFQHKMEKSFSKNTRNRLKNVVAASECRDDFFNKVPTETVIHVCSKHIVRNLQRELKSVFSEVEKYLSQFSSAVRKMQLEINCCLKKSSVTKSLSEPHKERSVPSLDVNLRKDILRIRGVYGVGTMYGQLEIHANPGTDITAVESEIRKLMKGKSHVYQFAIRTLESKPEIYVDSQYENGETIESLSPLRTGTLGGFVNGSDNRLYGLTCAHVVKSHSGQESDVFIKDGQNRQCLFAKSFPNLTVSTGEAEKPLIDIAAVRIVDHMTDKCIKFSKDDNGKIKPAVLAADRPSDLVGTSVYKHGAMSGLTKGMVCSDDYSVLSDGDDEVEYVMLIDNYGDEDDDMFAIPGDSGSTVCVPNQNEANIIHTVGVLSAGRFKPTGYDNPLYFAFRLYDGLRKLTSKAGGLEFNFPQICIPEDMDTLT